MFGKTMLHIRRITRRPIYCIYVYICFFVELHGIDIIF